MACIQLINTIVITPDGLDFRLHLKVKVFEAYREEDFYEFAQRFDDVRLNLDATVECFDDSVTDTPSEPFLLSILQHLLFIKDDPNVKFVIFLLCVHYFL